MVAVWPEVEEAVLLEANLEGGREEVEALDKQLRREAVEAAVAEAARRPAPPSPRMDPPSPDVPKNSRTSVAGDSAVDRSHW